MAKVVTTTKRLKISKAQQNMLLAVAIASLLVGVAAVMSIWLVKYIIFNTKVISAKGEAVSNYEQSIKNIGICEDTDGNGKFSNKELENCNPNSLITENMPDTLRYNVLVNMANNADLESVAAGSFAICYNEEGKKIDFNKLYQESTDDAERSKNLELMKMCSALRVIPDALPAQENTEATMASLNQLFIDSESEPETISPEGFWDESEGVIEGLGGVVMNVTMEADATRTFLVLSNIERSIREFNINTATIEWTEDNAGTLTFAGVATAYYTTGMAVAEETKTVYASEEAEKAAMEDEE